jgi:hypothetical protein
MNWDMGSIQQAGKNSTSNPIKHIYGLPVKVEVTDLGAQKFSYGKMGEVTQIIRTVIVPNQMIATYVTEWEYDSWNRLLKMTYPDNEMVFYHYNTGAQLESVTGEKNCNANKTSLKKRKTFKQYLP